MNDGRPFHESDPDVGAAQHDGMLAEAEHDSLWLAMFHQLVFYHLQNGHCFVPLRDRRHPQLAAWLERQVVLFHKGRLSKNQQREMEALGMEWDYGDDRRKSRQHAETRWEERFAEMVSFKKKHGHLRITLKNQLSAGLMHWRDNQRIRFRKGVMSPEQKTRLEAIGLEWVQPGRLSPAMEEHNVALWESMFEKLLTFREEHGHCQVPQAKGTSEMLGKWVQRQRYYHKKGELRPERLRRLEEIGFGWKSDKLHFASGWEGRFAELVAFKEAHGHLRITKANESSPGLSHWRDNQRIRLRSGALKPEQQAKLDALGFEWEPPGWNTSALEEIQETQWQSKLAQLAAFKVAQGHNRVPKNWRENPALGQWLQKQRSKFRKGSGVDGLLPERLAKLDALGTEWRENPPSPPRRQLASALPPDPKAKWEHRYARLVEFHRLNGHANVPGHPDRLLRKWVLEQRAKHAEGSLGADQITRLEALGFSWQTPTPPRAASVQRVRGSSIWDQRFAELQTFVAKHGHFRVPKKQAEFKRLRHWVTAQRVYHRRGSLMPVHREKLEAAGFPWEPGLNGRGGNRDSSTSWEDHARDLTAFKERHGHTRVQHHRGPDMKLGDWLIRQRRLHRLGRLSPERFQRLEALGVEWNPPRGVTHHGSSNQRMAELREFHAQHGHTNVPTKNSPNPLLGNWVSNTRISYKNGQLSAGRIQELEALGFRWQGERISSITLAATWEESFTKLLEFQRTHGHVNVRSTDTDNSTLAAWVITQRVKHRRGTLQTDRVRKLEAIGFKWGKAAYQPGLLRSWNQRFDELGAFRRQYGHPHVSKADKEHRSLEIWVKTQRVYYHQGKLSADQIQRLESIGFTWDGSAGWWQRQFRRWEAATQRRRTRHLTAIGDSDDDLAKWEQTQRNLQRMGKLSAEKASLLTRAGLVFEVRPQVKSGPQMPHQKLHAQL